MMSETRLLASTVSEYRTIFGPARDEFTGRVDVDRLIKALSRAHDWTDEGARAIVSLATGYGAFMLRNALALAIVLD